MKSNKNFERSKESRRPLAMVAYTNYSTDPRVIRQAQAAFSAGYSVDFYALRREGDPKEEYIDGVRVLHLNVIRYRGDSNLSYIFSYFNFFFRCMFLLTANFFRKKYKLIHVNNMPDFMVFVAFIPKLFGAKVFLDIHDPMPSTFSTKFEGSEKDLRYKLLLFQERLSAWFVTKVITVHVPMKEKVLIPHGIREDKIEVIANFADENVFQLFDDYAIEDTIKMVFHGTIAERFGLQDIVKELADHPNKEHFFLKIIGEGDYASRLQEVIDSYDLDGIVEFDHHFYPVRTLREKLSGFQIGLASYRLSEATKMMLPLKMLEYTSLGLPVITIRNEAIAHYFDKEDSFFYDPLDLSSLSEIFESMHANPQSIVDKRARILEKREALLWKSQAEKYIHLINQTIK